jgi:hypothetical protein
MPDDEIIEETRYHVVRARGPFRFLAGVLALLMPVAVIPVYSLGDTWWVTGLTTLLLSGSGILLALVAINGEVRIPLGTTRTTPPPDRR